MRHWIEILREGWFASVDLGTVHFDIYLNPTRTELARMINEDGHNMVRAWVSERDVYAFPASIATHHDVLGDVPVDYAMAARVFLDKEGPYYPTNTTRGEILTMDDAERRSLASWARVEIAGIERDIDLCANNPALAKLYGTPRLGVRGSE